MTRRMLWPLVFGLVGTAILLGLGTWQVQRMHWKAGVIAEIEARIHDAPVSLPDAPVAERDRYLPVQVTGAFTPEEIHVMSGQRGAGAGFQIISTFETEDGRRIMIERGFVPEADKNRARPAQAARVTGNLHWPQDTDSFTPDPDLGRNIWFSRDVARMAAHLGTEPVLVIARLTDEAAPAARMVPVTVTDIRDNHREYALTWFSLAAIWAGMTAVLLWRIRRQAA